MGLKVWLPLNNSLENKGTGNVSLTSGTPVFKAGGKIGANALNLKTQIQCSCPQIGNLETFSICFWAITDPSDTITTNWVDLIGFTDVSTGGTNGTFRWETSYGGSGSKGIHWHDNATYALSTSSVEHTNVQNTWCHCCVVFNKATNLIYTYANGKLINSVAHKGGHFNANGIWYMGHTNAIEGRMNDLRIYDHALSLLEIREISQGLVLHYKLDSIPYNFSTNQVTTFTNFTIGQYYYTIFSISMANFISQTGAVNGDKFTFSVDINATSNTKSLAARVQHYNSGSDRNSVIGNYIAAGQQGRSYITFTVNTNYTQLDFIITNGNASTVTANSTEQYKCTRIEKGDAHTGYIGTEITPYIQDSSGYGRNGTITGTLTLNSNSARHSSSVYIANGTTSRITTPVLSIEPHAITLSIWFKSTNTAPTGDHHMIVDSNANRQWYEMAIQKTGYFRGGLFVNGARKADNGTSTKCLDGNWHMITMTYDGTNVNRYVDGVMEKATTAAYSTGLSTPTALTLGRDGPNASYAVKDAYLSDFRVYCTALSPEDILVLYRTSAKADNLGNFHCFEFVEEQNNILAKPEFARAGLLFQDGLSRYTQANCQVTLTSNGYRIYRPPNVKNSSNGGANNMWGGLKIVNQITDGIHVYDSSFDNIWGLQQNHTYLFAFHAIGQSTNSPGLKLESNMGWDRIAGVGPNPTYLATSTIPANFSGEKDCYLIFTIGDTISKIATENKSTYVQGSTYLSYRHLCLNYDYWNTGELGTDLYLTDFRMYDITSQMGKINKYGQSQFYSFVEGLNKTQIRKGEELLANHIIEL